MSGRWLTRLLPSHDVSDDISTSDDVTLSQPFGFHKLQGSLGPICAVQLITNVVQAMSLL